MNKKSTLIVSIILVLIFVFVLTYLVRKNPSVESIKTQEVSQEVNSTNDSLSEDTNEYINSKYNFKFNYPSNWTIKEELFTDFYNIPDPIKGLVVVMNNPELPKKMYDCCYTPEEIEKYGESPILALLIYEDSLKFKERKSKEFFGTKTIAILNELKSKGYDSKIIENLLSFVPSFGDVVDLQDDSKTVWKDGCSDVRLLTINSNYVVKFSGCSEGVVENTGALFVRKDGLVFKLEDNASEYSKLGDFDKVLESFKFN